MMSDKKQIVLKKLIILCAVVLLTLGLGIAVYFIWEKPPELSSEPVAAPVPVPEPVKEQPVLEEEEDPKEEIDTLGKPENIRNDGVYTILLVGIDKVGSNTDTLMLCRFDTVNHTLNVVSIPRDTYANINWMGCRKINCIYSGAKNMKLDPGPMDRLLLEIDRLSGITADCYVMIDLNTFIQAVDLIGGISYDVPFDMDYDDKNQDLYIHLKAGPQVLDGYSAMGLWRYRAGYVNGDLGRLEYQHRFLQAVADQFLSIGTIPNIDELVSLVADNTETNLSAANFAWFARQYFKCSNENVNFYTLPGKSNTVNGYSYVFPDLEPWLELINSALNPYTAEITREDLECICMDPEEYTYYPSSGTFVDPRYLHAWRYYPENIAREQKKAEKEAAEKAAAEQETSEDKKDP